VTLAEFEQQVYRVAVASPICSIPSVRRLSATSISLRIEIVTGGLIDAFYNEQTGTTAFALIRAGRRAFGADNTGGWHVHPFADPEGHASLPAELSFASCLAQLEEQ
jgi:hypothetical protein